MSRRALLVLAALAACLVAAVPAFARSKAPVIKSISPLKAKIGDTLTIRGSGFVSGARRNTVVFMGAGKRVVWLKAARASRTKLSVKLNTKLLTLLDQQNGQLKATRLRIRVIARRSGRSFTKLSRSPLVSAAPGQSTLPGTVSPTTGSPTTGSPTSGGVSCTEDSDLLPTALELALHTDPCKSDTDGDGVSDDYEYQAALDFNRTAGTSAVPWPYPGKRAYPNPLDGSDAGVDHDGDGLTMRDEYQAWTKYGQPQPASDGTNLAVLNYSDGDQTTGPVQSDPAPTAPNGYVDTDGNGLLTDDEKDVDGDGLPNWDELRGRATQAWWKKYSSKIGEKEYDAVQVFDPVDWLDPDTNGDGRLDGASDQDGDGYTNAQELSRDWATFYFHGVGAYVASGPDMGTNTGPTITTGTGVFGDPGLITDDAHAFVNPFNPCLPDPESPTCTRHPPFDDPPSPFKGTPTDSGLHGHPEQIHWPYPWG